MTEWQESGDQLPWFGWDKGVSQDVELLVLKWESLRQTEELMTLVINSLKDLFEAYSSKDLFLPLAAIHPGPWLEELLAQELLVSAQRNTW